MNIQQSFQQLCFAWGCFYLKVSRKKKLIEFLYLFIVLESFHNVLDFTLTTFIVKHILYGEVQPF